MEEEKIQRQSIKGIKGSMRCDYLWSKFPLYIHIARYGNHAVYSREIFELLLEFFETNCGEIMFNLHISWQIKACLHELSLIHSAEELRSISEAVGLFDFLVLNSKEKMFS